MSTESPSNRAIISKGRTRFVPCPRSPNGIWGPIQPPEYRLLIAGRKRGRGVKVTVHPNQNRDKKRSWMYTSTLPFAVMACTGTSSLFITMTQDLLKPFHSPDINYTQIPASSYFRYFLYMIYKVITFTETQI